MGLFYLQTEVQSDNTAMFVLFVVILLFNIYFVLVWTYRFLDVLLRTYVDRLREYRCLQFLKEREVDNYDLDLRKIIEKHYSSASSYSVRFVQSRTANMEDPFRLKGEPKENSVKLRAS